MGTFYFSAKTRGWYNTDAHKPDQIPDDAVKVTQTRRLELLKEERTGALIVGDKEGKPIAVEQPVAPVSISEQILQLEASITPRRIREAVLGTDGGWLADVDAKICELRKAL